MTYNASDPRQVEQAQRRAKRVKDRAQADLRMLLQTEHGRRFLWSTITDLCGVYTPSFTGNSETFWREGKRAVGLALLANINEVEPSAWALMTTEANEGSDV